MRKMISVEHMFKIVGLARPVAALRSLLLAGLLFSFASACGIKKHIGHSKLFVVELPVQQNVRCAYWLLGGLKNDYFRGRRAVQSGVISSPGGDFVHRTNWGGKGFGALGGDSCPTSGKVVIGTIGSGDVSQVDVYSVADFGDKAPRKIDTFRVGGFSTPYFSMARVAVLCGDTADYVAAQSVDIVDGFGLVLLDLNDGAIRGSAGSDGEVGFVGGPLLAIPDQDGDGVEDLLCCTDLGEKVSVLSGASLSRINSFWTLAEEDGSFVLTSAFLKGGKAADGIILVGLSGGNRHTGRVLAFAEGNLALSYEVQGAEVFDISGRSIAILDDLDGDEVEDWVSNTPMIGAGGRSASISIFSGQTGSVLSTISGEVGDRHFALDVVSVPDADLDGLRDIGVLVLVDNGDHILRTYSSRDKKPLHETTL